MIGMPKVLNTRADYENLLAAAKQNPLAKACALAEFRGLLEARFIYEVDKELGENEQEGEFPEFRELAGEEGQRVQYKRKENPTANIFALGFEVSEVEEIINSLEGEK